MARLPAVYSGITSRKSLRGLQQVMRNLDREILKIKQRTLKGLIKAHAILRADMDATFPKIPADTWNLWHSYFMVTSNGAVITGKNPTFVNDNKDAARLAGDHAKLVGNSASRAAALGKQRGPTIIFGFSAYYAVYVHELVGSNIKWTRGGSGAKFFEAHVKSNSGAMLRVIAENVRIPK